MEEKSVNSIEKYLKYILLISQIIFYLSIAGSAIYISKKYQPSNDSLRIQHSGSVGVRQGDRSWRIDNY